MNFWRGKGFTVMMTRKPYSSDVSDDEWAFVLPFLTLMTKMAPQRHHDQASPKVR